MYRVTSIVPYMGVLAILLTTTRLVSAVALTGYDCGSEIRNITTISIVDIENEMLEKNLLIASTQPDEFAYRLMEGPGYMAVLAGEVIHIVQCVPVEVKLNRVDKCYNRLPVLRGNDAMFLTPRTRIIAKYATEVPCSSPMPEHYYLHGTWYKFMPHPVPAEELSYQKTNKLI